MQALLVSVPKKVHPCIIQGGARGEGDWPHALTDPRVSDGVPIAQLSLALKVVRMARVMH